jgi:hypothetical protein
VPLLSWRVALLPFLTDPGGRSLKDLYDQFHHDEPWDSQHNFELLGKIPSIYKSPGVRTEGTTSLMVFTGPGTPFGGTEAPRLADIRDGTANTILCVEASPQKAVPWTKPEDLAFDFDDPLGSLGKTDAKAFAAVFWDGSVRAIPKDVHPESLRRLVYPHDGRIVFGPTKEDPGGPPIDRPAEPAEQPPSPPGGIGSPPSGASAKPDPDIPSEEQAPAAGHRQPQPAEPPFGAPPEPTPFDVPRDQPQPESAPKAVPDPFAPSDSPSQPHASERPTGGATPETVPEPFSPTSPASEPQGTESPNAGAAAQAVPDPFAPTEPVGEAQATESASAAPDDARGDATSQPVSNPFLPDESPAPAEATDAQEDATSQPASNPFLPEEPSGQSETAETEDDAASPPASNPLSPRGPSEKAPASQPPQTFTTFPPEKPGDTPLVGGPAGAPFRLTDPKGRAVIGVRYRVGSWARQKRVSRLEPLFGGEPAMPGSEKVVAREGYAVGALRVDAGKTVNALEVVFMRVEGDRLNRKDWYKSDWIGAPGGGKPYTLGGGARVLGIYGRRTIILDAVGLVLDAS